MLNLQSHVSHRSDLLATRVNEELIIMDVESGAYFNLDTIGAAIWERIGAPVEIDRLCHDLEGQYDADIETIRHDVLDLLEEMRGKGLVKVDA